MEIEEPQGLHWLRPLLKTKFYDFCPAHAKLCNKFCKNCKTTSLCEECTSKCHQGHEILSVYKASHYPALRVRDVTGKLDISNIHRYSINSQYVLFLQSRKTNNGNKNIASMCACGWELKKDGLEINNDSKFCSFDCKLRGSTTVTPTVLKVNVDPNSFKRVSRKEVASKIKFDTKSYRNRSRKGVPVRAPLL